MLREEIKLLKTGRQELRKFGWVVGGVFTLIGALMAVRGKPHFPWFLSPGVTLIAVGTILPLALKWIYIAWMTLALMMGWIVSNVILTLFFYLVVTPVGLVARLAGKDFLNRKMECRSQSYWTQRPAAEAIDRAQYEKQF
jgi:hypothetical protein